MRRQQAVDPHHVIVSNVMVGITRSKVIFTQDIFPVTGGGNITAVFEHGTIIGLLQSFSSNLPADNSAGNRHAPKRGGG